MGADKATIEIDGTPMAERVVVALAAAGAGHVSTIGGAPVGGATPVPDRWPGEGPLGGVLTALSVSEADVVVVSACDLREPSDSTITALVRELHQNPAADIAVPMLEGHRQLDQMAIRRRSQGRLMAAFDAGERSLRAGLERLIISELSGLDPASLVDADTPGELPVR